VSGRRRLWVIILLGFVTTLLGLLLLWGAAALWYQGPGNFSGKLALIALWALFGTASLVVSWMHRPAIGLILCALACIVLLIWWGTIRPSNHRIWAADVSQMTRGTIDGSTVVLQNVRDFDWRSDIDFTPRWDTRRYDLNRLRTLDLITSYWTGPAIAHVLLSFGFDDGQRVAFSVEIRREQSEGFSAIGGFFKEFELSVIAADERDVIRVRTNIRGEDDYLYRIRLPIESMRSLFLAYVAQANSLVGTPRFYNTITTNCTTLIYHMMQRIVGHLPMDYRLLLSGYLPGYVYQEGGLDTRYSLEQLKDLGRITDRARAADRSPAFSEAIRAGIPSLSSD
jgi:Domain of unknown function (DUF4105)